MNIYKYILSMVLMSLISACGGGGGGGGNSPDAFNVDTTNHDVLFSESLDPSWGEFRTWESRHDDAPDQVQWKTLLSDSADHNSVIDVTYGAKENVFAQFQIIQSPPVTEDLSGYATGKISFDVNVIDWGDSFDINTGKGSLEVRAECVWPCTSHPHKVSAVNLNTWTHVEINIADMVVDGLDLKHVDSAFIINPPYAHQKNAHFQIDNIKWTKGTTKPATTKIIFAEHFDTTESLDKWSTVIYQGDIATLNLSLSAGIWMLPIWTTPYDDWALITNLPSAINIKNKKGKVQLKAGYPLAGNSGYDVHFSLLAIDGNGNQIETPELSMAVLKDNEWAQVIVDIGSDFGDGFNPGDVRKLGIRFNANGKPPGVTNNLEVDEILITE